MIERNTMPNMSKFPQLEFVEMATKWLGYSPRGQGLVGGVEQLIAEKEALILETYGAIKIQSSTKITVKHKINIGRCPYMFCKLNTFHSFKINSDSEEVCIANILGPPP